MPRPRKVVLESRPITQSSNTNGHSVGSNLIVRKLSPEERAQAYKGTFDTEPYVAFISSMEPGTSYGVGADRKSARSTRVRLTRVAKQMGTRLRWAKVDDDADELIVELYASKR